MRKRMGIISCLSLVMVGPCAAQTVPSITRLDASKISTVDADVFAKKTLEDTQVTGAQIVVLEKGKLVWSAAYGQRRREPGLPMKRETMPPKSSHIRGKHSLRYRDKPVAKQLPLPLENYEAYREKAADLVKDPEWAKVTPRMLLSHTSGLANFSYIEPDKKMHLHFKPGTQFLYSGEGINLVQFVIEEQKKKPLDQLMQEAIFTHWE